MQVINPDLERAQAEARHLQQTVIHMRERLEADRILAQQASDRMRAEYTQEIRQMGLTIAEMRAQLEKAAVDKERAVSQTTNAFGAQIAD